MYRQITCKEFHAELGKTALVNLGRPNKLVKNGERQLQKCSRKFETAQEKGRVGFISFTIFILKKTTYAL